VNFVEAQSSNITFKKIVDKNTLTRRTLLAYYAVARTNVDLVATWNALVHID